jgi:hypothetical protein
MDFVSLRRHEIGQVRIGGSQHGIEIVQSVITCFVEIIVQTIVNLAKSSLASSRTESIFLVKSSSAFLSARRTESIILKPFRRSLEDSTSSGTGPSDHLLCRDEWRWFWFVRRRLEYVAVKGIAIAQMGDNFFVSKITCCFEAFRCLPIQVHDLAHSFGRRLIFESPLLGLGFLAPIAERRELLFVSRHSCAYP